MTGYGGSIAVCSEVVDGFAAEEEVQVLKVEELEGKSPDPDAVDDVADGGEDGADDGEHDDRLAAEVVGNGADE